MLFKRKYILVSFFSAGIIALVLVSTVAGYGLYLQWKEDADTIRFRDSIQSITAQIFRKDIVLTNIGAFIAGDGPYEGFPVFQGTLGNSSGKTIAFVSLSVSFADRDGRVLYLERVYPLIGSNPDVFHIYDTEGGINVLPSGQSVTFRHLLRNCPERIVEMLRHRDSFAKGAASGISMDCRIDEVKLI